ncbi:MAG: ribosome maturation factor RimM [Candidatus Limimorpha sp.]
MTKDNCFFFGKITKTHGLKGELTLKIDVANPGDFTDLKYLLIDENKNMIPYFIDKQIIRGDKMFLYFQGVDTLEKASFFVGKSVFLPNEFLPELDEDDFYYSEIIGFTLFDESLGEIGKISDVIEYPTQAVIQVMKDGKEILIPVHDDIITKIVKKEKSIVVRTPEGLVNMYLNM